MTGGIGASGPRGLALARDLHVLEDVGDTAHLRAELLCRSDLEGQAGNALRTEQADDRLLTIAMQLPYRVEVV